jgi:hypothetical protein
MGGFVVDVHSIHNTFKRVTLTPFAVVTLAREGLFLDVPEDAIRDKSKADVLAKTLVLFQVGWMVIQVIGRKISDLPITLLEIHTLVHVVCALIMYLLWFKASCILMATSRGLTFRNRLTSKNQPL